MPTQDDFQAEIRRLAGYVASGDLQAQEKLAIALANNRSLSKSGHAWPIANQVIQTNEGQGYCQQLDDVVLAANGTANVTFVSKEDFLWCAAVAQSTGAGASFTHRIRATWENGNYLENDKVRQDHFWGTAKQPNRIPPKFVPRNAALVFELADLSGAQNTVRISLWGFRIHPKDVDTYKKEFGPGRGLYCLATDSGSAPSLAANGVLSVSLKNEDAYHFRICQIQSTDGGTNTWFGNLEFKDVRYAYRTKLSNEYVHSTCFAGSNVTPFYLPAPPIAQRGNAVLLQLKSEKTAGGNQTVRATLVGERC